MDPRSSAQDLMLCDVCETAAVLMYCDPCLINLCVGCVGEHLLEEAQDHRVVRFQARKSDQHSNKCSSYSDRRSDLYCKDCCQPVCAHCIASGGHSSHNVVLLQKIIEFRKKPIMRDQRIFNRLSLPAYQRFAGNLQTTLAQVENEYQRTIESIKSHGEKRCSEINEFVCSLTSVVAEKRKQQVQKLQQQIEGTEKQISGIEIAVEQTKDFMDSRSLMVVSSYKPKCQEFRHLPEHIQVTFPKFEEKQILRDEHLAMFGTLTIDDSQPKVITIEIPPTLYSGPIKDLLDDPRVIRTIDTYHSTILYNVAYLKGNTIFTTGNDSYINHISLDDTNASFTYSKWLSGKRPWDIAVNRKGIVIYSDRDTGTVMQHRSVQNGWMPFNEVLLTMEEWIPLNIAFTFSGDLLVIMNSKDHKQTKVVRYSGSTEQQSYQYHENGQPMYYSYDVLRYSGSTEQQSYQYDEKGQPLYHSYDGHKSLTENGNLDVCVADCQAGTVVVVDQSGKLRFRYSGPEPTPSNRLFCPRGLTTDSQCQLLISDISNDCVHITDQDGQFLRYIECGLSMPWGICTDEDDNLYVAECQSKKVKKIKYLE